MVASRPRLPLMWRIRTFWTTHNWDVPRLWLLFFLCVAAWFFPSYLNHHPPVGVYIAVMGLVTALMAIRKEPSVIEKVLWIFVITGLMFAEVRNIYRTDKEQTDTFQAILCGLRSTDDGLKATAQGIKEAVQGINTTSLKISKVSDLAEENLENVTGGKSYAAVTPQVWSGLVPIPLSIYNYGKQTLTGVTVTVRGPQAWDFIKNPNNPYSMYQAEASAIDVGNLHRGEMKILNQTITPTADGDHYQLDIAAQNFTVTEELFFKRGVHVPWTFRYTVMRQFVKSQHGKTTNFGYEIMKQTKDWMGDH